MSAVIAWTCKQCGHHAEGLDVEEYLKLDSAHVCKVADVIRRAVRYFRRREVPTGGRIADWLEACATWAAPMTHPGDFDVCDEPESVRHALAVAQATPWEEESI
jgi:hypothetical protein